VLKCLTLKINTAKNYLGKEVGGGFEGEYSGPDDQYIDEGLNNHKNGGDSI